MRWTTGRRSENVIDARGRGIGLPVVGGGLGMAVLALIVYLLGGDPGTVANLPQEPSAEQPAQGGPSDQASEFVSVVLADTEDTWQAVFRERFGRAYQEPELVLFTGAVQSACGFAQAAVGPFYCPRDQRVYIDLAFYRELRERFAAPGDFAQAYVIAPESFTHGTSKQRMTWFRRGFESGSLEACDTFQG